MAGRMDGIRLASISPSQPPYKSSKCIGTILLAMAQVGPHLPMEAQCERQAMQLHAAAYEKPVFRAEGEPGNRERLYSHTDVGGKLVARRAANLDSLDCRWARKITKDKEARTGRP